MAQTDPAVATTQDDFRYGQIWWIGFGFLGVMLGFSLYNAFVPIMYAEFIDSRTLIGLLMSTDNLVGLLLIPVVGAWSDRMNHRLGRRLPFIVVAVPVAALSLAAIPWAASALWTLIVVEIIFTIAMHSYRGPVISLMPDHTPPEKRSTGNGIINLMGGIGTLTTFAVLSQTYDDSPELTFGIAAGVLLATGVIVYRTADRHPAHVDNTATDEAPAPLSAAFRGFLVLTKRPNRGQFLLLAAMFAYYIGFAGLDAMFPLYGVEVLGLTPGNAAFILTAFAGAFLVAALFAGMLGTRLGKIPAMSIGLAAIPVLFVIAAQIRDVNVLMGVFVVGGFAWALVNVQAMPLIADLGGRSRIGFYIGMYYLFTMVGQMLGSPIIGGVMDLFGDEAMFYGAAGAYALGFVLLQAGRRQLPASPEELARREVELGEVDPANGAS
ncbi:MAG: MFS transporter [Nitriliruptoraceae bacterium]|nr:MFS transporter [Nitriliruptoraceae bacterium]